VKINGNRVRANSEPAAKNLKVEDDTVDHEFLNDKIEISGDIEVTPIDSFNHPSISKSFLPVFSKFQSPTPIQSYTWPILLQNRDVISIAKTGSGKTLAFGVPCVQRITKTQKPAMLVIAPTRELAVQIFDVLSVLSRRLGLKTVVVYGGTSRDRQAELLEYAHIIVATPGRLLDFLRAGYLDISNVSYLIIDEADQMLDMGFEPDMITINGFLSGSENRLTAMFSATWPKEVQELADLFLTNPILLSVGKANGDPQANKSITQNFQIFREPKAKLERLLELLNQMGPDKRVLVFTQTKIETNVLSYSLQRSGISSRYISSNLSQMSRERVLSDFKAGNISVLVATDVASRGLDIPDVEAVVNYSFPQTIEAYVHRIGRTGRAGKRGNSYTFLTPFEFVPIKQLISVIQKSNQVVPPELYSFKSMKHPSRHNNRSNSKTRQKFNNNNNNNLNNRNNNNKLNSNRKPQMKESTGEDDFSVLKNLKKKPKKLGAIVKFIKSLN